MIFENILVFVAHPDDEILGLGTTVAKLSKQEKKIINCVIFGEGLTSRANKRFDVSKSELDKLKEIARKSADIVGYSDINSLDFPDNRFDSVDLLEIIKTVSFYVDKYKPDTIFTHHYGDLNIDHQITFKAVITACRPQNKCCVKNILSFETPSSTEWNFGELSQRFNPNYFVDIEGYLEYKPKAIGNYVTESTLFPHPRSNVGLETISKRWGTVVDKQYVEAFELIRSIC